MYKLKVNRINKYAEDTEELESDEAKTMFLDALNKEHNLEKALSYLLYDEMSDSKYGKWCPSLFRGMLDNHCNDCSGRKKGWVSCWEKAINDSNLLKQINIKEVKNK